MARREQDDHAAYVAARWPALVRTLVLLGASRSVAEDVTGTALHRCGRRWARLRQAGDVDAEVLDEVLRTWADVRDHEEWWGEPAEDVEVEARLDRLSEDERQAVVLAAVAGRPGPTADPALVEDVRRAAEAVPVGPARSGPGEWAARAAARRRRDRVRAVAGVAAAAAVLVGATYVVGALQAPDREEPVDDLAPVAVERRPNPAGVVWWAGGLLHLEDVVLRLPSVVELVAVDGGAVVVDGRERVVLVTEEGERTLLGERSRGTGLAASRDTGWVAWVEPDDAVVVHDVVAGRRVERKDLDIFDPATGRVVAVEDGVVHLTSTYGDVAWRVGRLPVTTQPPRLLDVAAGVELTQSTPERIGVEHPVAGLGVVRPGRGGRLTTDGAHVVTAVPDGRSAYGTVRVYDASTGERLPTGIARGDVAVVVEPGRPGTVAYVLARVQDLPRTDDFLRSSFAGRLVLRTCAVATGRCRTVTTVPGAEDLPVLATPWG